MAKIEIKYEGQLQSIDISEGESILEAGLREGMDLPYSCMSGICTACMALVTDGNVEMEGAEAIDEEDVKLGKVLTCCAFVKSESAKVDYTEND